MTVPFWSPMLVLIFYGRHRSRAAWFDAKGCRKNLPAPVKRLPLQPVAGKCPLWRIPAWLRFTCPKWGSMAIIYLLDISCTQASPFPLYTRRA
jgi:hypothetical protein